MKQKTGIILILILIFMSLGAAAEPDWSITSYTNSTTLYATLSVEGYELSSSDKVGAFVGNECRAIQNIILHEGIAFASLVIQGETIETVGFKIWISEFDSIFEVQTKVETNPGGIIGEYPDNMFKINYTNPDESPDWVVTNYTNSTTLYATVSVEGHSLTGNDVVGAFAGEECRGVQNIVLNEGQAFVSLVIQGETEETISFKIWISEIDSVFEAQAIVQSNPGGIIGEYPDNMFEIRYSQNKPPVANAGEDKQVREGEIVALNGKNSYDPDGDSISFHWASLSGIYLENNTDTIVRFETPQVTTDSSLLFVLTVTDSDNTLARDTVEIIVENVNHGPVARTGDDIVVGEFEKFEIDGSGSFDEDDDSLNYLWLVPDDVQIDGAGLKNPKLFVPEVFNDESFEIILKVSDGELEDSDTLIVNVLNRELLLADYKFNNNLIDSSLFEHDGNEMYISFSTNRNDEENSALLLDGLSEKVNLGDWFTLNDFTISFWVKPKSNQKESACILNNNYTNFASWCFQQEIDMPEQYSFKYANSSITMPLFYLPAELWTHVAIVFNNDTAKFYRNGTLLGKRGVENNISYNGTQQLIIGNDLDGNQGFKGVVDEVRIYNYELSPDEVAVLHIPVNVEIIKNNLELNLWPNPCNQKFQINRGSSLDKDYKLTIVDTNGKVFLKNVDVKKGYISTEKWSEGIYLVMVSDGKFTYTKKLMVVH